MGQKRTPGLRLRNGIWHLNGKVVRIQGQRFGPFYESTGESTLEGANEYLQRRVAELRRVILDGGRPRRTFRQAATHYLETENKASLATESIWLEQMDPFIGSLGLHQVHDLTLRPFLEWCGERGNKSKTIKLKVGVVRRILNLCAQSYRDPATGLTWLPQAPKLSMPRVDDARQPYPLSWAEQRLLFPELPPHLARMALYAVNTGCRDQEICRLKWSWEVQVPELNVSVFVLPRPKNHIPRVVVLNSIARKVVEEARGQHPEYVFVYSGRNTRRPHPVDTMNNTAWQNARALAAQKYCDTLGGEAPAGFLSLHVHDLRHTFSRRLRSLGVSFEARQDLLGHKNGNITTHYSAAELRELLSAVAKLAASGQESGPLLTLLRATS